MKRSMGVALVSLLAVLVSGFALFPRGGTPPGAIPQHGNLPPSAPVVLTPALEFTDEEAEAPNAPTAVEAEAGSAAANSIQAAASSQDLAALRDEVTALQAQITVMQLWMRRQDRVGRRQTRNATPDPRTDQAARAEAARVRQQQMTLVEASFHQERTDPLWASAATSAVQAALADDEAVQNLLLGLECRTQTCRMELAQDDSGELAKTLPVLLRHLSSTLPHAIANYIEDGTGGQTMILYLSREAVVPSPAGK